VKVIVVWEGEPWTHVWRGEWPWTKDGFGRPDPSGADGGYLVPNDPEAIAAAVTALLSGRKEEKKG
jgi:hypothetical protein